MVFNSNLWRSFNYIPEVAGNMESELAISALPFLRRSLKAVVTRSLVLVMVVTPGPTGGHQG